MPPHLPHRRHVLRGGLAALGYGLGAPLLGRGPAGLPPLARPGDGATNPFRRLDPLPDAISIEGLPFAPWFTGDDFRAHTTIPFHTVFQGPLPATSEEVDVAVVGGGVSGLATAYLLRDRRPVVLELHPRFGGNAQGEGWRDSLYSLGSAYVITPDKGTFLDDLYTELGLDLVRRESFPPDPMALHGAIHDDFWSGAGPTAGERAAFERYGRVVARMANEEYPEIPLAGDPVAAAAVRALDQRTFREDLERQMGAPLTPLLAAGVQSYFYSSFGAGMDEISAAAGWNFVAAEEFGRWVFPGGNAHLAWTLWSGVREVEAQAPSAPPMLRAGCAVVDVRREEGRYRVTWVDPAGTTHALAARYVVMAASKHICKHALHKLNDIDPRKATAMQQVDTAAYLVANVLLDAPVRRDFYDVFLIGDASFPMTPGAFEQGSRPVDVLDGSYTHAPDAPRNVLTLYWPLPWATARFRILDDNAWRTHATAIAAPLREALALLDVEESAVRQVRLSRWGHAMPIARPGFIAEGHAEALRRPFDGQVYFANQDNWALPAIENSLLDAEWVSGEVRRGLG